MFWRLESVTKGQGSCTSVLQWQKHCHASKPREWRRHVLQIRLTSVNLLCLQWFTSASASAACDKVVWKYLPFDICRECVQTFYKHYNTAENVYHRPSADTPFFLSENSLTKARLRSCIILKWKSFYHSRIDVTMRFALCQSDQPPATPTLCLTATP